LEAGQLVARLKTTPPEENSADIGAAFRYLGRNPSPRDLGLVADRLRRSGVDLDYDDELVRLAEASDANAHVALDLVVAVAHGVEALTAGPPWASR
jgi:hypothetical protein